MILSSFFVVRESEEAVLGIERGVEHAAAGQFVGSPFSAEEALTAIEDFLCCGLDYV